MGKAKIRKSIIKRFKVTKTGKILRRLAGQDHFRAKKPSSKLRKIRKLWIEVSPAEAKKIKKLLSYSKK